MWRGIGSGWQRLNLGWCGRLDVRALHETGRTPLVAAWRVIERRGRAGLVSLEADWRRLYAQMPQQTLGHLFEAYVAYADHLAEEPDRLRCLALADEHAVRAICVLEARTVRAFGLPITMWRTASLPQTWYGDIVCPDDEARRVLIPAIVSHLRRTSEGAALLHLTALPKASSLWDGLQWVSGGEHCVDETAPMHVVDCRRSFESLTSGLSAKSRANLRKSRRKLDSLSDVSFTTVACEPDLSAAFETFLQVEASGWKGANGTAILQRPGLEAFLRSLRTLHHEGDHCAINALHADGRCIAAELCFSTGDECVAFKIGYDEQYSRFAPGLLLVEYSLERCCRDERISRLNWIGDSAWERRWHPHAVEMQQAYIALHRWSGRVLVILLRIRNGPVRRLKPLAAKAAKSLRQWRGDQCQAGGRRTDIT